MLPHPGVHRICKNGVVVVLSQLLEMEEVSVVLLEPVEDHDWHLPGLDLVELQVDGLPDVCEDIAVFAVHPILYMCGCEWTPVRDGLIIAVVHQCGKVTYALVLSQFGSRKGVDAE